MTQPDLYASTFATRWLGRIALALSALGVLLAVFAFVHSQRARTEIARQNHTLLAAGHLLSTLKDLETGERGYAITGEEEYLEPYHDADNLLDPATAAIGASAADTSALMNLVAAKRAVASEVIAARRTQGADAARALIMTGQGKVTMDAVRVNVAAMETTARQAIARTERSDAWYAPVLGLFAGLSLIAATGTVAVLAHRRRRAERESTALLGSVLDSAPIGLGFRSR